MTIRDAKAAIGKLVADEKGRIGTLVRLRRRECLTGERNYTVGVIDVGDDTREVWVRLLKLAKEEAAS